MEPETSNTAQTESANESLSGQRRDRRTVLRTVAASSLAAAMIGVGGRTERAAAQDSATPEAQDSATPEAEEPALPDSAFEDPPADVPSPEQMAEFYKQWILNPNGPNGEILSKSDFGGPADFNFSLKGMRGPGGPKFLQWERQTWGINLGWTNDATAATEQAKRRWFVTRNGNDGTSIRYGETIALGNGNQPSWLYYSDRPWGINLKWSEQPRFEWQILGGQLDEPVRNNERVAILNLNTGLSGGEPLIYFNRTVGGDIGWPTSQTLWDQIPWRQVAMAGIRLLLTAGAGDPEDDGKGEVSEGNDGA